MIDLVAADDVVEREGAAGDKIRDRRRSWHRGANRPRSVNPHEAQEHHARKPSSLEASDQRSFLRLQWGLWLVA
ncbi:MAG TPA: hypothetical protein VF921_12910, partial [Vicinamibacterales bacterium]